MREDSRVSLLDEIQVAATDPSHSLSDLLRKCQILAFRLRHEPFKDWVSHELNGYPDDATLPGYRGSLHGEIKADLAGAFGRGAKNVSVPLTNFPAEVRDRATQFKFYQGVAVLESLVADARRNGDPRAADRAGPSRATPTALPSCQAATLGRGSGRVAPDAGATHLG